jgi:hypothetical protein
MMDSLRKRAGKRCDELLLKEILKAVVVSEKAIFVG